MTAYTLTAANGSYAYSGNAARVAFGRRLVSKYGRYVLDSVGALLQYGVADTPRAYEQTAFYGPIAFKTAGNFAIITTVGTYSVTAFNTNITATRQLPALAATFTYTGNTASVTRAAQMAAGMGAYNLDGKPAAFVDPLRGGVYILSFPASTFGAQRKLAAGTKNYVLDGYGARMYESSFNYPDKEVMRVGSVNKAMTVSKNRAKTMYVERDNDPTVYRRAQDRGMSAPNRNRG